jgi:hypothetical protein
MMINMPVAISGSDNICQDVLRALGIKEKCRSLTIKMEVEEIVTVKVEYYPSSKAIVKLEPILKKLKAIRKKLFTKTYLLVEQDKRNICRKKYALKERHIKQAGIDL